MCRIKGPYIVRRQAFCAELKVVQWTETGIMSRINGPYSGWRQALFVELKVRTLDRDRYYLKN